MSSFVVFFIAVACQTNKLQYKMSLCNQPSNIFPQFFGPSLSLSSNLTTHPQGSHQGMTLPLITTHLITCLFVCLLLKYYSAFQSVDCQAISNFIKTMSLPYMWRMHHLQRSQENLYTSIFGQNFHLLQYTYSFIFFKSVIFNQ